MPKYRQKRTTFRAIMAIKKKLIKLKKIANQRLLNVKLNRKDFKEKLKNSLIKLKEILKQESKETKQMLETYQRYTLG